MFRDNKREIFGFRKYKAYGLASAVIAAFFLMGGVASADEVTSAPSDTTAHVVTSPTETSADNATVASGEEVSANNTAVENTVANTATTNTVTETRAVTVEANTATETPAVASGDRASANTETASATSPYVSEQAKQSVLDNLVPLAEVQTSAPTATQVYKEAPDAVSKLTSDDRVVEKENKEAFDKLPDAVRRRVKSVTIEKKENGNLGHTASISGNVTVNAQYFHNDGKDGETEVLYHEIGHAIDGATYKRNADGSDYSLSRDTAVQPLIQKAYPGQVNYEGWASMFGTYMLQKTGQREIKTELDREINNYFANLMVGFTEAKHQDEFVNVKTGDLNVTVSTRSTDRTVVATSADSGVKQLNNLTPQGLDITVSGKGALTENSYIDVTVETNLPVNDINKDEILTDTFKGTSYVPTQGDYKKSTQTARISLAGLTDGTQKEYVIQANEFHKDAPVMSNLKRIVTYKVYIDGTLRATKVLTDMLIPADPVLDGKTSETQYVRTRGESTDDRYLLTSDDSVIKVNSKRPYGVYEVTVPDDVKMTLGQDESLESYRAGNKYVLPQNVIDAKKIRFNTSVAARKALDANPDQKRLDQTVAVSYYYSDKKFEDISSVKKIEMSRPLVTLLSDVLPGDGLVQLSLSIEKPRVFVLSTSNDNFVKGTLKNGTISSPKKAATIDDTLLTLNMDEKPLNDDRKFILQPMRTDQGSTVSREFRESTMKVSVVDADTGVKIGVAEAYKALDIPKTTKRLKLHVETNEKLGYLQDSTLSELHYSVTFKSNAKDAISWKKDMDNQNSNETETRFKFDLLNDQGGTIVNNETKLTIFNDKAVVNIGESTYAVFTPTAVQKDLFLPILTSKALRNDVFPLAALEYVKVDDSNNIIKSRVFYTGPIEDESRRPVAGSYVDTVYDGSPGLYSGIWFKSELPAGTNVYEIPVHLKMKDPIYALNDKGGLVNGESHGYLRVLTYDAKSRVTLSTISYKSQYGKKAVIDDQTKEITLSSYVYNMTDNSVDDLSAMAYIPKAGVENSTVNAKLVRKIDAPSGWKVLYTTNDISGDYSKDRNLAFSESVDDYTKVTALKFVAEQPVAAQSGKRFDVPVLTKMTNSSDAMYYRTTLLTGDKEVLSAPVVATPDSKSLITKLTIKHVLDPNDAMTNKFRNMSLPIGDLQHYDLQQTGELKQPVVKTISAGSTELISKLASKSIYEPYDISTFGDGLDFDYTRVTAEMTDDLKEQLNSGNINVDTDTSIQGTGKSGSEATITYYYKVRTGKLVERFVNKEGVEIAPTKESAEAIAYGEFVPTDHPNSIEYGGGTYNYDSTDAPSVYRSRLDSQPGHTRFGVVAGTTTVTYVYDSSHEVPGDAPSVEIPELKVTRYMLEDRVTEIKDANENFTEAPKMIGNYEFTGVTDVNESNDVQTHIYKRIETEIPGDAPQVDVPELKVTRYMLEDRVTEVKDANENFTEAPKTIGDYQFTGVTDVNESNDVQTHIYKRIETEIPGDAPQVDVPELKVTRYMLEDRVTEIKDANENFTEAPKTIGDYQFTGVTDVNESNDVQTHIYTKIVTEIPGDAPIVDIPELRLTRHISDKGKELLPIEEGSNGPRKTIGDYEYTGRTDVEGAVTTHVYAPIRYEIPGDAPQYDIPELKATRHVDEKGKELIETEKGTQPPRKTIGENEYTGRTTEKDGITTHVYKPIKHEIPGDAPQYDIPELKVTRHVDEKGKELIETEKGTQPPRKTIRENEYTGRTTEKDGITTHVYKPIKHEVPGDAPQVDVPELKVTRYVNEKGEEIKESEAGFINAPKTIGEYEFTGRTELNDGKDVQTHIYKLVEKPVTPTPDPKKPEIPSPRTPEPKKPETPQPEAPKPIETPKSNDSVVESSNQPQFVKDELPKTGETNSNLALVGVSLLTALGLIGFVKRKREE